MSTKLFKSLKIGLTSGVLAAIAVMAAGSAQAGVISENFSSLGIQQNSQNIAWNVTTDGGLAKLDFELAGFATLDGYNNCCSDIFHLAVNGNEIFTGSFNLGGGGSNVILFNPNGGSAVTTTFGATDNVHNTRQVTRAGGVAQISIPVNLLFGANEIKFSYTGYAQALLDEGWGINQATITAAVPEPATYGLLGAGMFGLFLSRRRFNKNK